MARLGCLYNHTMRVKYVAEADAVDQPCKSQTVLTQVVENAAEKEEPIRNQFRILREGETMKELLDACKKFISRISPADNSRYYDINPQDLKEFCDVVDKAEHLICPHCFGINGRHTSRCPMWRG